MHQPNVPLIVGILLSVLAAGLFLWIGFGLLAAWLGRDQRERGDGYWK